MYFYAEIPRKEKRERVEKKNKKRKEEEQNFNYVKYFEPKFVVFFCKLALSMTKYNMK